MLVKKLLSCFFLAIFIILSDIEESPNRFLDFYLLRVHRWLNRFVYITTNHSCCPLNCSSVRAKSPICRSPNTLFSCSTSTSPSAATTSMSGKKQPGGWPGLSGTRPCPTPLTLGSWPPPWTTCPWGSAAPPGGKEMAIVPFQSCGDLCWGSENPWSHGVSGLFTWIYINLPAEFT